METPPEDSSSTTLLALVVGLIALELLVYVVKRRPFSRAEALSSWAVGIGYFAINVVASRMLFYGLYVLVYENFRIFTWAPDSVGSWVALMLGVDFVYYWVHRWEHEVRVLWCTHENHHSAQEYNLGTAVRMPWGEVLYKPFIALWRPVLGFPPIMYPVLEVVNLIGGLIQHTRLIGKLGPLEEILVTPSHHRVHHGADLEYLDKNYGARLIIWDRLFGTFQREAQEPTYGLTKNLTTHNPFKVVLHGYALLWRDLRAAPTWKARLGYVLKPPGWRHDGTGTTTADRVAAARRAAAIVAAEPAE